MIRRQLASVGFEGEVLRVDVFDQCISCLSRLPVIDERRSKVAILRKVLLSQQRTHATVFELQIDLVIYVAKDVCRGLGLFVHVAGWPLGKLLLLEDCGLDYLFLIGLVSHRERVAHLFNENTVVLCGVKILVRLFWVRRILVQDTVEALNWHLLKASEA